MTDAGDAVSVVLAVGVKVRAGAGASPGNVSKGVNANRAVRRRVRWLCISRCDDEEMVGDGVDGYWKVEEVDVFQGKPRVSILVGVHSHLRSEVLTGSRA